MELPEAGDASIEAAVARLEDEFRRILHSHSSPPSGKKIGLVLTFTEESGGSICTDSWSGSWYTSSYSNEQVDGNMEPTLMPSDAIHDLRCIAGQMIAAGYTSRCIQVYASVRKSSVDQSLQKLGIEKLSFRNIQRLEWHVQKGTIQRWIWAIKFCVREVFLGEKRLCQQIFRGLGTDEVCFAETVKDSAIQLLNFAGEVSTSRRSIEKLFKTLDLYNVLSNLLPEIETLFESKSCESIRVLVQHVLSSLAEAARAILSKFESVLLGEISDFPIQSEAIHSLAQYVMDYICQMVEDYKEILDQLIVSKPLMSSGPSGKGFDVSEIQRKAPNSILALHLIWIIEILKFKLEVKSKKCEDPSRAHLFMMNHIYYIFAEINLSVRVAGVIGCDYVEKLRHEYRFAGGKYIHSSRWKSVLDCLKHKGVMESFFLLGSSKCRARRKLKAFNSRLEEVREFYHQYNISVYVPDVRQRIVLSSILSSELISTYQTFLEQHKNKIKDDIKYSVDDLKQTIVHIF